LIKNHRFIRIHKQRQSSRAAAKLCVPSHSAIFGELSWSDNIGREG
jgi:hypothetical protein